jgi:hypothetical protein
MIHQAMDVHGTTCARLTMLESNTEVVVAGAILVCGRMPLVL